MSSQESHEKIVVIYDTFCGWCYGAAPVLDAIVDTESNLEVLHRHLFQGDSAHRMRDGKGAQVLKTIPAIEALTGQVFSDAFKSNIAQSETEVLASDLSAQAAALVHDQGAEREFSLRQRLETLHFTEGVSSGNRRKIIDALIAEGVAPEEAERIGTPELAAKAAQQSERARSLMAAVGSRGVPTVLKVNGGEVTQIDHQAFYGQPETVAERLS